MGLIVKNTIKMGTLKVITVLLVIIGISLLAFAFRQIIRDLRRRQQQHKEIFDEFRRRKNVVRTIFADPTEGIEERVVAKNLSSLRVQVTPQTEEETNQQVESLREEWNRKTDSQI